MVVACAAGLGVAVYLTIAHYGQAPLVCTIGGIVDCGSVTHSAYSEVATSSPPISVLGILWFVLAGMLAAAAVARPGWRSAPTAVGVRLVVATSGLGYVLYLVYVELVQLHRICEWCTAVHVLTLAVFVLSVRQAQRVAGPGSP